MGMFEKVTDEIRGVVTQEVDKAKREVATRAKRDGAGIGLIVGAVLLALLATGAITTAAIAGLATEMPLWLAALVVAVAYLLIGVVLALAGKGQIKKGGAPLPRDTMASFKEDVRRARNGEANTKTPVEPAP